MQSLLSFVRAPRATHARSGSRQRGASGQEPPHAVPAGREGAPCPVTGLTVDGSIDAREPTADASPVGAKAALEELRADPDIEEEDTMWMGRSSQLDMETLFGSKEEARAARELVALGQFVPLNVVNRAHKANSATRALVRSIGGLPTLRRFTSRFYELCFQDAHIDQFIRRHEDGHGERFALWIAERFGDGTPWTEERRTRKPDVMRIGGESVHVAFDRSSAHYAAWHSHKRPANQYGEHFKPHDARVWMRLHFWAARDAGLFEPQHAGFMDYYVRFIAHFMSVYSSKSPPFARESARWSADQQNIDQYLASGRRMVDVFEQPLQEALDSLPRSERLYTGSGAADPSWPYGHAQ